jgi:hypothetical protein
MKNFVKLLVAVTIGVLSLHTFAAQAWINGVTVRSVYPEWNIVRFCYLDIVYLL